MSSDEPHASISFPDGSHVRSSSTGTSSVNTIDATLSRPNYIKKPSLHIMSTSTTSTTTDLVTNPILSNISVPKISPPTSSSIATATSTSHVTGTASHSNIKANANTSTSVNKKNMPPTTMGGYPLTPSRDIRVAISLPTRCSCPLRTTPTLNDLAYMPPNPLLLLSPLGTIGQFPCRIPMRALLTAIMTTLAMKCLR
ncbi:hypothetical protein FOB22_006081 [Saccharomyces cerevisiae]|nr:hypothetical protein FOB22_006081 [Saccharomyces cerevisiae]